MSSIMFNQFEHPSITHTLRAGYPRAIIRSETVCSVCGEKIPANMVYGVGDIGNICRDCEDELDKQFKSLTFSEKLMALGMDVKYNG